MNAAACCPFTVSLILAQTDRMNTVSERFQGSHAEISLTQIAVFVVVAIALMGIIWWVARLAAMRDGRSYQSPQRLFADLCQLHQLDWPSRRLLRKLAKARQLEHPARLFLEPTWFDSTQLPRRLQPFRTQLAELKRQLFQRRL